MDLRGYLTGNQVGLLWKNATLLHQDANGSQVEHEHPLLGGTFWPELAKVDFAQVDTSKNLPIPAVS
jgi:hypothetical protein